MALDSYNVEERKLYLSTMRKLNHNVLPYILEREYEILFRE